MSLETILILSAVGLFAGAWNAVAGGATLFTFPALMAAGLPPVVANATNYPALLPSNAAALPAYRHELAEVGHRVWPLLAVSGAGALVGAWLLTVSDPELFMGLIPFLILTATGLFAFGPMLRVAILRRVGDHGSRAVVYPALFVMSIYGGYFGAGLSFILMAMLQVLGFTAFHTANALKNLLATSFTVLSILVFGFGGLIAWPEALVMMAGSTAGGYLGGHYGRRVNGEILRRLVIVFGLVLSAVYFYRLWVNG